MVSNRTVNPQKVKAWARPGIVLLNSFFCPPTSTSLAWTRAGMSRIRPGSARPDRTRRARKLKRLPAMAAARTVTTKPTTILTGNGLLLLGGQGRKFSKYRLGVGPLCPWYFEPRPDDPYGLSAGVVMRRKLIWPLFLTGG